MVLGCISVRPRAPSQWYTFFENGPHILQNPCNHTCNKTVCGIRMMGYCTLDIIIFFSTSASSNCTDFLSTSTHIIQLRAPVN